MKKLGTLIGAAALLAATIIPAFAANSCTNSTTGPASNNTCSINNTSNVTVNNVNDAQIINKVRSSSNTGGNSASNNTLGGNITTGNASANVTVATVANVVTNNITAGYGGVNNIGDNSITGPFSKNNAFINNDYRVDVYNSNTATVKNKVEAESDTGNNNADNNTGPANIATGDSWLGLSVGTHVNDVLTTVDLAYGYTGNNTAFNSTTGPFSTNTASINNSADVRLVNVNDLQVKNFVRALSNTGRNSASNNTLGGDITTGDAEGNVIVDTEGNIVSNQVAMAMGGFANNAGSSVTGPSSNNNAFIQNARNVLYENWNNKCKSHNADRIDDELKLHRGKYTSDVTTDLIEEDDEGCEPENLGVLNLVNSEVDAGNNDADNNTGGGGVVAGWASLVEAVLTHLNDVLNVVQL